MKIQNKYRNRIIFAALGFGIAGAIWGLEAYRGTVGAGESFTNPFSYILGAVALGVFGGLALSTMFHRHTTTGSLVSRFVLDAKNCLFNKLFWKILILGTLGWIVAFFLPAVWVEWWAIAGGVVIAALFAPFSETSNFVNSALPYLKLAPDLKITLLIFQFGASGVIAGFVYSLIFKVKILRTVLWSAGGFALAALIGPILGNLIGGAVDSLLASYILTFVIICVILGICLSVGIYKEKAEKT